jgi:hypothetical protein
MGIGDCSTDVSAHQTAEASSKKMMIDTLTLAQLLL